MLRDEKEYCRARGKEGNAHDIIHTCGDRRLYVQGADDRARHSGASLQARAAVPAASKPASSLSPPQIQNFIPTLSHAMVLQWSQNPALSSGLQGRQPGNGSQRSTSSLQEIHDDSKLASISRAEMAAEAGQGRKKKERSGSIAKSVSPLSPTKSANSSSNNSSPSPQRLFQNSRDEATYGRDLAHAAAGVMDRRLLAAFNATNEALRRSIVYVPR